MADVQQLIFDILTRDRASEGLSKIGRAADGAARDTTVLNEKLDKLAKQSAEARVSLKGDKEAQAALDKLDAKLLTLAHRTANPNLKVEGAARAIAEIAGVNAELDKLANKDAPQAGQALSSLTVPGGGMGALVGAGALLAPVLVTVGTGLAGFGAAAAGAILPIENAAKKTGGLQANMALLNPEQQKLAQGLLNLGTQYHAFEKALQPQVLSVFNDGVRLAGHLMHDVEPVASATGKALGGLVNSIDAEFRSNNWQNFFHFMAQTAGPDVKLLSADFVSLSSTLPTLLEGLQPVASALLTVVNYTGQAIRLSELASTNFSGLGKSAQKSGDGFNATTTGLKAAIPGLQAADNFAKELGSGLDILYGNSGKAAKSTQGLAVQQFAAAKATAAQAAQISKLNAAMTANIAKTLTLEGDEVSWKQAQQAATAAINANHKALDGNSSSALAARAAIISATQQVIKFADDSNVSTGALHRGSSALQDQITWLEKHAGKSKIAAEEIHALREEEAKIKREIDQRVKIDGSGRWSVAGSGSPGGLGHRVGATGGRVPGYGGGDVHPYLLEGGEAIVPKHLTPAVAPFLKAQGVPGFAAGGIIPGYSGGLGGLSPWVQHNMAATDRSVTGSIAGALAAALRSELSGLGSVAPASGSALAAQNYARSLLALYGWGQGQMSSLIPLWNQESGWNAWAVNPSSGAYGIPQSLGHGHPYALGDYKNQVIWGLNYIRGRYGSPAAAEQHELSVGWYDRGGALPPGLSLAYNGTGKPERVGGGGTVINISVSVPPTVNPRDAGRQIADLLKPYIKGGGTIFPAGVVPR